MAKRPIRFVPQLNKSSGCGPACVAMVGGSFFSRSRERAYREAAKLVHPRRGDRGLTSWNQLRGALDTAGLRYASSVRRAHAWSAIQTLAIVKCGDPKAAAPWHYVLYDGIREKLYDPLREGPTRPKGATRKPTSFLEIL